MRVELKLDTQVLSASYLDYALPLSVVLADPEHLYSFLNFNLQVFFPDSMLGSTRRGLHKFLMQPAINNWQWSELGFMKIEPFKAFSIEVPTRSLLEFHISEWLSAGYYIETRLNEFYLPCRKLFYRRKHCLHINLVTGIDTDRRTFTIAGFSQKYDLSCVSFDDFASAFFQLPENDSWKNHDALSYHRMVWLWRPVFGRTRPTIDCSLLSLQCNDYLLGRSSLQHRIVANDDVFAYPDDKGRWGVDTYQSWKHYLDRMERAPHYFDVRASRTFWEHKVIMALRCRVLSDLGAPFDRRITAMLDQLISDAKAFRLGAFAFSRTGSLPTLERMRLLLQGIERIEHQAFDLILEHLRLL